VVEPVSEANDGRNPRAKALDLTSRRKERFPQKPPSHSRVNPLTNLLMSLVEERCVFPRIRSSHPNPTPCAKPHSRRQWFQTSINSQPSQLHPATKPNPTQPHPNPG
jgi:hypothetical protein